MPVQTKVKQRTLPNSENFIAPELHIGQKERKTTRSVSDVPLTGHQPPNKYIIEDKSIALLRLLQVGGDNEEDGTGIEPLAWNLFYEVMVDEIKSPTTGGYGTMYPPPPTNSSVLQASVNYFMSLTNHLGQETTVITGDHPIYEVLMNIGSGTEELLVESSACNKGTADKVLNG